MNKNEKTLQTFKSVKVLHFATFCVYKWQDENSSIIKHLKMVNQMIGKTMLENKSIDYDLEKEEHFNSNLLGYFSLKRRFTKLVHQIDGHQRKWPNTRKHGINLDHG